MNETLPHAVARMRSQGFSDHQIAGQIHRWHAGWTPGQVSSVMAPAGPSLEPAAPKYHGSSRTPTFPGQQPDHFLGRARVPIYKVGHGQAAPPPLSTVLGAPPKGVSPLRSQHDLGRVYQQNHPVGQQILEGIASSVPGVSLAKGIANSHVTAGTLGTEALNDVTSGLLPVGKAAAVFGGLRGLRRATKTATAIEDATKVEKVAKAAPQFRPRTVEEARAHLETLDKQYNDFIDSFVSKKLTKDEVAENRAINTERGKFKRQQTGKTKAGKASGASGSRRQMLPKTVNEQKRAEIEAELGKLVKTNPDHPGAQAFARAQELRDELRAKINAHEAQTFLGGDEGEPIDFGKIELPPEPPKPAGRVKPAGPLSPEAAALRQALSGKAGKEALDKMGDFERIGSKVDEPFAHLSAEKAYKGEAALRADERAERFAKGDKILADKSLTPDEALAQWKDATKGELPKVHWRGFDEFNAEMVAAMKQFALHEAPNLRGTQKVTVLEALNNAVNGIVPRPHELVLLEQTFGKDTANGFVKIAKHPYLDKISEALNIPRTLMATLDFSAVLRQGLVIGVRHPGIAAKNFGKMFKAYGSEKYFQDAGEALKARPNFPLYLEGRLPLTSLDRGIATAEEPFLGAQTIEKGKYNPIRASNRAYTFYLDQMRADVFDRLIRQAQSPSGIFRGLDPVNVQDPKFLRQLGKFIGNASGRGTFDHKALEEAMPLLNLGLFSPRLIASRMTMLWPPYYYKLDPFLRREALVSALGTFGAISTVLGLAKMAGAKVGTNPRSADFGKIKLGNTRIDIAGGFQQYFHLLGELVTREKMNSTTGAVSSLTHPKFGQPSLFDVGVNFLRGKAGPIPGVAADWATGESGIGHKFSWTEEAKNHFFPLIGQDMKDLYHHPIHGMNGIEAALAGYGLETFGTGVQTYEPKAPKNGPGDPFDNFGGGGGDPFDGFGASP